ncbi:hypothetical protein [Amycolatopsis sp. DG1A-15b]|uniref:hypothetical protein n=1 Tax=Amycolatopsis sp. DG1A-15b TaxID=3052846 RepID=UPI00255BD3E6|nr:hypothetical protein [Amycolatopsis sp. DG1A-15b]WIX89236.1 hypothetical protein QRY02_01950 [Amycolatopsis sp. DG1A-15b]
MVVSAVIVATTWATSPGVAVVGAVEHRDHAVRGDRQPGLDLFEVVAAVFGMTVFPAHRSDDCFRLGRDRVQRPSDPVVVQPLGRDAEDLLDRPLLGPLRHPHQRRR